MRVRHDFDCMRMELVSRHNLVLALPALHRGFWLWDEKEFSRGLAGFEVAVSVCGVGERVDVFEAELDRTVPYGGEDVFGTGFEVG